MIAWCSRAGSPRPTPDCIANADDGPQRYASVSLAGSGLFYISLGAACRVTDRLRVGATVTDVVSKVVSRLVLSGCPGPGHPD